MPPKLPMPKRSAPPPAAPTTKPPSATKSSANASAGEENDIDDSSFISTGDEAKKKITEAAKPKVYGREFFITKKEMQASADGQVTARVHFAINYAKKSNWISVPRVSIKEGANFASYTSPDNGDCAFRKAGVEPSIRPVYVIVDHRQFKRQDNSVGTDDVKMWIPYSSTHGVVMNAIKDLAESVGVEPDENGEFSDLDITKYEAKITKIGMGRKSTWAVSFVTKEKSMTETGAKNVAKFFGDIGYRKTMAKLLAPDPKYLLSKGGHYEKPSRDGGGEAENDTPPFASDE